MRTLWIAVSLLSIAAWSADVNLQRVPENGLQPQVLVSEDGTVHLIYIKGDRKKGDVMYTTSRDGSEFSPAVRVNSQADAATVIGNIRGAQLALGKNGRIHVAWNGTDGMYYSRSKDGGGFEPERNVSQVAKEMDGGGSVAADATGNVYVVWHAAGGEKGEAKRRVWIARSTDEGKTFSREAPVWNQPTGVCGCCNLKAFVDSKGTLHILYRAATEMVNRDIYLIQSRDKGQTFSGGKLGDWKISTCPMSTMFITETSAGVMGTWETRSQIYFSPLGPKATTPIAATGIGTGRKYSVLAANKQGDTLVVWTEGMGWEKGGAVAWQVYDKSGKPGKESGRKDGVPVWGLVATYAKNDGSFVILY